MAGEHRPTGSRALVRGLRRALAGLRSRRSQRDAARAQLREAEAKYRTLVEQLPLVTYIDAITATATALYASPQVETLLGYTVEEWLADPEFFPKLLHPDDRERVLAHVEHCNATGDLFRLDYRLLARDGRTVWVQDESKIVCDEAGTPLFTQGYLLDITERKQSDRRLAAEHGVTRVLAASATLDEAVPRMLETICTALGWELGAFWVLDPADGLLRRHGSDQTTLRGVGAAGRAWHTLAPVWAPHGERYAAPVVLGDQFRGVLEFGGGELREPDAPLHGTIAMIASQLAQFIERKEGEARLTHQALHDPLTDLPNRRLFHDRVSQAVAHAARTGTSVAVMLMDLDRFKEVNDTVGHESGDRLLRELGERLRLCLRAGDTVARLGGDEFGFVLPGATGPQAVEVVDRIHAVFAEPFELQELPLQMEASVGIALAPDDGLTVDLLLRCADVAMYVAKRAGRNWAFYDERADEHSVSRLAIVGELRAGIERGELVLHYQPQVNLRTGAVTGVEALVRWQHPERGLVMPDEFIGIAERTGLIESLTRYVVGEALRQCSEWRRLGHDLHVAVNVSTRNLIDSSFPSDIGALLERFVVPPDRLTLEITERTVLADPFRARAILERLSTMGLRLSIDDFGTGYSSLAYLRRLPLDEVKIDRSFIGSMHLDHEDAVIVRSTISLARDLGLAVVAEGVESAEIYRTLAALGCDAAQGYYMSRPLPADALTAWVEANPGAGEPREQRG